MIVSDYGRDQEFVLSEREYRLFKQLGTVMDMTFNLAAGDYEIRTVLGDLNSGKISTLRQSVKVDAVLKQP